MNCCHLLTFLSSANRKDNSTVIKCPGENTCSVRTWRYQGFLKSFLKMMVSSASINIYVCMFNWGRLTLVVYHEDKLMKVSNIA